MRIEPEHKDPVLTNAVLDSGVEEPKLDEHSRWSDFRAVLADLLVYVCALLIVATVAHVAIFYHGPLSGSIADVEAHSDLMIVEWPPDRPRR